MGPREMKVEGQSRLTRRRGILKQNRDGRRSKDLWDGGEESGQICFAHTQF